MAQSSELLAEPTSDQQKSCSTKTGFNLQDLDPNSGTTTMGMNRDKYEECMKQPYSKPLSGLAKLGIGVAIVVVIVGILKLFKVF